jgi:hypothetical protein
VFRVGLTYAGGVLHVAVRDTETGAEFARDYEVDIPAAVDGATAYAGFTAGTGALYGPLDLIDWELSSTVIGS